MVGEILILSVFLCGFLRTGTDKEKSIAKEHSKHNVTYVSRRRPVTEEEKNRAFQMAKEEVTEGSFLVVMRPTHVYKSFFLVSNIFNHLNMLNNVSFSVP